MSEKSPEPGDLDETTTAKPASAEDRKAATALAQLDSTTLQDSDATKPSANVDAAAVSEAMARLEGRAPAGAGGLPLRPTPQKTTPAKTVKVDQADVALLVDQLDMNKTKATELLKQHDGDAVRAMRAFVRTPC